MFWRLWLLYMADIHRPKENNTIFEIEIRPVEVASSGTVSLHFHGISYSARNFRATSWWELLVASFFELHQCKAFTVVVLTTDPHKAKDLVAMKILQWGCWAHLMQFTKKCECENIVQVWSLYSAVSITSTHLSDTNVNDNRWYYVLTTYSKVSWNKIPPQSTECRNSRFHVAAVDFLLKKFQQEHLYINSFQKGAPLRNAFD